MVFVRTAALLMLLLCPLFSPAETTFHPDVRKVMVANDRLYLRAGFLDSQDVAQQALEALWGPGYSPQPVERFKSVPLDALVALYGGVPERLHLFYRDVATVHQAEAQVQGAALYQWACDGSLVPVLDLGPWPWADEPDGWPPILAMVVSQPVDYQSLGSAMTMQPGQYHHDQQFSHELLLFKDKESGTYLQLDWNESEFSYPVMGIRVGREIEALEEVSVGEFFPVPC